MVCGGVWAGKEVERVEMKGANNDGRCCSDPFGNSTLLLYFIYNSINFYYRLGSIKFLFCAIDCAGMK